MPEIGTVAAGETIEAAWGNAIRDRTFQRYTNSTDRDTSTPAPTEGDLAYLEDTNTMQFYSGSAWVNILDATTTAYLPIGGGTLTGALSMGNNRITNLGGVTADGDALSRLSGDTRYARLAGATMAGTLNMGSNRITNLPTFAVAPDDAISERAADDRYYSIGGGAIDGAIVLLNGTVAAAGLRFASGGAGSGLYYSGGVLLAHSGQFVAGAVVDGSSRSQWLTADGVVGAPGHAFINDRDTGSYLISAGHYGIGAGGAEVADFSDGDIQMTGAETTTNNGYSSWRLKGGADRGLLALISGSRFKRNIKDVDRARMVEVLRAVRLRQWQDKGSPKDSPWISGVVADEIAEIPELRPLVGFDDAGPLGFDSVTGLANYMVAGIQSALDRLDAVEAKLEGSKGKR